MSLKNILIVDNHDSFTWNIVRMLDAFEVNVHVNQNHGLGDLRLIPTEYAAVILGPGPGLPEEAGALMDLLPVLESHSVPTLGICLGHQAMGLHFGWKLQRAKQLMHGKTSPITHEGSALFANISRNTPMMRYHSWVIQSDPLTRSPFVSVAFSGDSNEVMACSHQQIPMHGIQFHPESFLSVEGHVLIANFMQLAFSRQHTATQT